MDVVGHKAIGKYFNFEFLAVFPQPGQIRISVCVGEENVFAPIPTLRDVVGYTGKDCPG